MKQLTTYDHLNSHSITGLFFSPSPEINKNGGKKPKQIACNVPEKAESLGNLGDLPDCYKDSIQKYKINISSSKRYF